MIMERNLAPVIVFSFSKKDCESYACAIAKLDFNSGLLIKLFLLSFCKNFFNRWWKTTCWRSI